jgi:poly(3-hydroxybutyrate) depolymerase
MTLKALLGCAAFFGLGLLGLAGSSTAQAQVAAPDDCITDTSATPPNQGRRFRCAGGEVDFTMSIPPACVQGGCGIIVDMPGATQPYEAANQNTGLRQRTRSLNFIVIGAQRPTPQTPNSFDLQLRGGSADEVFDFVQRTARLFRADMNRIHAGGFSQGARMTFNLICDPAKTSLFASVAPAASEGLPPGSTCFGAGAQFTNPTTPLLYFNGRNDMIAPFAGEQRTTMSILAGFGPMRAETINTGVNGFLQMRFTSPTGSGRIFERIFYDNTNPRLGGHCFPGPFQTNGGGCDGPNAFEIGAKTLQFYMANPKGGAAR